MSSRSLEAARMIKVADSLACEILLKRYVAVYGHQDVKVFVCEGQQFAILFSAKPGIS